MSILYDGFGLDGIRNSMNATMAFFTGYNSEKAVHIDKKIYQEVLDWVAQSENERCAVLLANKKDDVITPTRFVTDENLTKRSKRNSCMPNIDEIKTLLNNCDENVGIFFHSHPGLNHYATTNQSPGDRWNPAKHDFIDSGKEIFDGIATVANISIYENYGNVVNCRHEDYDHSLPYYSRAWKRLDVFVDGKLKHPAPFFLEYAENICVTLGKKLKLVYEKIQTAKKEITPLPQEPSSPPHDHCVHGIGT